MKLDLKYTIKDLDGKDLANGEVCKLLEQALLSPLDGDNALTGDKKAELFALAIRLRAEPNGDFTAEDRATLKERVGKGYPPLVVGRLYEVLEDKHKPEAKAKGAK